MNVVFGEEVNSLKGLQVFLKFISCCDYNFFNHFENQLSRADRTRYVDTLKHDSLTRLQLVFGTLSDVALKHVYTCETTHTLECEERDLMFYLKSLLFLVEMERRQYRCWLRHGAVSWSFGCRFRLAFIGVLFACFPGSRGVGGTFRAAMSLLVST